MMNVQNTGLYDDNVDLGWPCSILYFVRVTSLAFSYFHTADLIQNTERSYEIHSVLLPICTAATDVKVVCQYCSKFLGCNSNPHSQSF
jgi:hypothetical protein